MPSLSPAHQSAWCGAAPSRLGRSRKSRGEFAPRAPVQGRRWLRQAKLFLQEAPVARTHSSPFCRHRLGNRNPSCLYSELRRSHRGEPQGVTQRRRPCGIPPLAFSLCQDSAASVVVAIEVPHGAVVEVLLEHGFEVFSINPKQLDRFRDRYFPAGAKDDGRDAFVLADSLRTDQHCFRAVRVVAVLQQQIYAFHDLSSSLAFDEVEGVPKGS